MNIEKENNKKEETSNKALALPQYYLLVRENGYLKGSSKYF
ncbi:unnamed protein product [marine sediment metagenome]|uniref:Uncharacterized protein n=1 Tax=marine sediment metagenome TaxID=412755 RepID=X1CXH8_9ZZZZ